MNSRSQEFFLSESIYFENELIYFFNINPYNSSINIFFEIHREKVKLNNARVLVLKDIITKEKDDIINFNVNKDIELKMKIKIINKYNKKDLFESFQNKMRESLVKWEKNKKKKEMKMSQVSQLKIE